MALLAAFRAPYIDYHALAPEIVLTGVIVVILLLDLFIEREDQKVWVTNVAGVGLLASLIPIFTLAIDGADRSMFGGAYVVDNFSLLIKALFLVTGYVVLLMSTRYIEEGDYYEGEFSFLVLSSLLGMVVMGSARDLITIFVALELLSLPAYMLAGWRKRDLKSNEAALKYYLLGVLSSAVMLYGMSLIFGITGTTVLPEIAGKLAGLESTPIITVGIFFIIVGFAFKVSAVPFHFWAPDTYEGSPTPVTAFLSVASKTGGFVALFQLVFIGFPGQSGVWGPLFWVLAALSMTVGNLVALRQTNIVRMLAYSSIAQAGYIMVPFAVAGANVRALQTAKTASIVYLLIYAAMNLGAFAVVIAVAPQDPIRRDLVLRRAHVLRPRLGRADDLLHVLAGRHPTARRVVRQVLHIPRRPARGHAVSHRARRDRRGELGDRARSITRASPRDVDEPGARRRYGAHPCARAARRRPRHHRRLGDRHRRVPPSLRPPRRPRVPRPLTSTHGPAAPKMQNCNVPHPRFEFAADSS